MNVTGFAAPLGPALGPSPAASRSATLLDAARRAASAGPGNRVALLLAGVPVAAHRRRVLKVLLQDAAQSGGGQVFETTTGEMLLLGTHAAAAARAGVALGRLAGTTPLRQETWHLPQDAARLLAWVEAATLLPPAARPAATGIAGLDTLLAGLAPEVVLRRRAILRLGAEMALPGRLLELARPALAAELGLLAADADLHRHAEDALLRRLLPQLAAPGPLRPQGTLLLPLPVDFLPVPAPRPGLVGVLPLLAAADPDALAERRAALAEQGWGLAVAGLDAAALRLLAPEAIAADWLLLHWSPALAALSPGFSPALAARCLLVGCDGPEALSWGMARGLSRFVGPHVESLLAAARLGGCREAAGCTQRQCGERAATTASAARIGCRNHALLDATLPLPRAVAA